jgi:hypothetical protein
MAVGQARGLSFQVGGVVAFQGVLVGAAGRPPTHAQVLHRVQKHTQARDLCQLWAQPRNHSLAALFALGQRLEVDEHEAAARARATGKAHHGIHRRVTPDDVDDVAHFFLHGLKADALVRAQPARDLPTVLLRERSPWAPP